MNEAFVMENTGDYDEWLIEQLKDPEEALVYLEAALAAYEEDSDDTALMHAVLSVARAQNCLRKLAAQTGIDIDSLERFPHVMPSPKLDNLPAVFSSLGVRVRLEYDGNSSIPVAVT
ncbi:MAG: hypothetical protein OXH73_17360 [Caldilineaceae bacterium]|nr:hypothetical protein [Caldilineaceae bacterium]